MKLLRHRSRSNHNGRSTYAFTLLEVMIALGIFFIALFSILGLVSQNLRSARSLINESGRPTVGMVAAQLSMTNKLYEGTESGEFEEYPEYSWTADIMMFGTNGLFEVNIALLKGSQLDSDLTLLLFRPESPMN